MMYLPRRMSYRPETLALMHNSQFPDLSYVSVKHRRGPHLLPAHEALHGGVPVADGHHASCVRGDEGGAGQGQAPQLPGAHGSDEDGVRAQRAVHLVRLCVQKVQPISYLQSSDVDECSTNCAQIAQFGPVLVCCATYSRGKSVVAGTTTGFGLA